MSRNYSNRVIGLSLLFGAFFVAVSFVPHLAFAQSGIDPVSRGYSIFDIIPCGTTRNPVPCTFCHLGTLIQNIINVLIIYIAGPVATLFFAYAGYLYMSYGLNEHNLDTAKTIFKTTAIGFFWMLAAWLVVDTVIKTLGYNQSQYGPWNQIVCVNPAQVVGGLSSGTGSVQITPGSTGRYEGATPRGQAAQARATDTYQDQINRWAQTFGVDPQLIQAIMMQESGGRIRAQSGAGALGLMQVMPGTARQIDQELARLSNSPPAFTTWSDAQIRDYFYNNPDANIQFGTYYVSQQVQRYNGDVALVAAAYNGGPGANRSSVTCAGTTIWQCEANRGYQQTRDYVPRVLSNYQYLRNRTAYLFNNLFNQLALKW
jgi:hypothetical protein